MVTGGGGFLGKFVIKLLKQRGCTKIFVPREKDYDLRKSSAVKRYYKKAKPDIVIHLAAVVGGIGANKNNPGKYFYDSRLLKTSPPPHFGSTSSSPIPPSWG